MIAIPETELMQTLAELRRQHAAALALLHELEEAYAKQALTDKPGVWRHDPRSWKTRVRSVYAGLLAEGISFAQPAARGFAVNDR